MAEVRATPQTPERENSNSTLMWIKSYAMRHFACPVCRALVTDPVVRAGDQALVCRTCTAEEYTEVPPAVLGAVSDLRNATLSNPLVDRFGTPDDSASKNIVRARRSRIPGSPAHDHTDPEVADIPPFQGMNPNVQETKTPPRTRQTPEKAKMPEHVFQMLIDVQTEETKARSTIAVAETMQFMDIRKKQTSNYKHVRERQKGSSKQSKVAADELYEKGEYAMSIEMYTKAITVHDGTAKLQVLYGNRSAAYFMNQDYEKCIEDCLEVAKMDTSNVRIFARAIKAAVTSGDLNRAMDIYRQIPEDRLTEDMKTEGERISSALPLLERAKANAGTPDGDEAWKMLVSQFVDTTSFRLNYGASLAKSGKFEKAFEVLSVVVGPSRTAFVAMMIATYMYNAGFEHFEQAKTILTEYKQDPGCEAMLQKITGVDDGKQRGNSLFANRQFAESIAAYSQAIDIDATNGRILRILFCNRAAANKELGKYREGIEDCTKAIGIDPQFSKAYARRARCYNLLQDYRAAIKDFKKAIQLDPSEHEYQRELRMTESNLSKEAEKEKDYYYVLGIDKKAVDRDIKMKYKELSLRWHPDKCMSLGEEEKAAAERKFKAISEAYATLIDPAKRREYDLKTERERLPRSSTFNFGGQFQRQYSDNPFGGRPRYHQGNNFW